jgi:predicted nucleic acid-binding protein
MKFFLDSDVLLDFFLDRQPFSNHTMELLSRCEKGRLHGCTTPLALANIYYLLRRTNSKEKSLNCIRYLVETLDVIHMDRESVIAAINAGFGDFEDALQYAALAQYKSVQGIVTRNVKDYRKSVIPVHTPESFLALV